MDRETGNIVHATQDEDKHNTICVGHYYAQTNRHKLNKTCNLIHSIKILHIMS